MRADALPLTYDECRARFTRAASSAGAATTSRTLTARGPDGQRLSIDVATHGDAGASRVLTVMSGVHGVEGFACSAIQCDLLSRLDPSWLPAGTAVVVVHAVNPWGMAWWRRQNESNVDLNRNWARDRVDPPANHGYAALHPLLVPGGDEMPAPESFLEPLGRFIDEHGIAWVRDAVTRGQYTHPDGLYFGGDRVEESTALLAEIAHERLPDAELSLTVDLHTGHGRYGTYTLLSAAPAGSDDDRWLRSWFDGDRIEATVGNPDATTATKVGQLAIGLGDLVEHGDHHAVTFELGTVPNTRMILAERAEHWVHRHGERSRPDHAAAVWEHRICSTPDDPAWERTALTHGRTVLDAALRAVGVEPR